MPNIHYQIHSNDTSKSWVVLVHGLFGSLDNLSGLRRLFSTDYQVLSIDLPDHGKSAHSATFAFNHYAEQLTQLLNELAITKVILVGHSLGGKIAMKMVLDSPSLITQLIVLDIAPVKYFPRHTEVFKGLNNINLSQLTSRKDADALLSEFIEEGSTRKFLLKSLYNKNDQWCWRFNLQVLQRDYHKLSAEITSNTSYEGPVLFIKGGLSDYLLLEHKSTILELFPNSQSRIISDTGHWLHAEKTNICYKLIIKFIHKNK